MRTQLYLAISSASAPGLDTAPYHTFAGRGYTESANPVTDYPAGTLIVDIVDAKTNQLVWHGQGMNRIPSDSNLYGRQVAAAVHEIVAQFPKAAKHAA
jgi:hypothetical protein